MPKCKAILWSGPFQTMAMLKSRLKHKKPSRETFLEACCPERPFLFALERIMQKSVLLRALQQEIRRHDFNYFMGRLQFAQGGRGLVVPSAGRTTVFGGAQSHLPWDVRCRAEGYICCVTNCCASDNHGGNTIRNGVLTAPDITSSPSAQGGSVNVASTWEDSPCLTCGL